MPTIRDVAKQAGVAPMTVSRVINNSGYVSTTTRGKVETAIEELGYVPNMLGHSLRFKQTNTLALLITDITNPYWTTLARGVEDAAQENGYNIILCNTDESTTKQDQYLTMLLKRRIDGILLVPTESTAVSIQSIQKQGIAVVVIDRDVTNVEVDIVRGDSIGGAYQLAHHLIELGHEHIAILSGPQNVSTAVERVDGFQQAMQEAHLPHNLDNIFWGEFSHASGVEMANLALAINPQPTALLAANNFIAHGALEALSAADLQVPQDLSLVSFDDTPANINPVPFFTVAAQPAYDIGYQATQILLERLANTGLETYQKHILPVKILKRQSTAPPAKE